MNNELENNDTQNFVPLSNDEIKSILKSQSESIFEDKNISNNSNFQKKSLIEIALDFESNQKINKEEVVYSKTSDTLKSNIITTLTNFNTNNLQKFEKSDLW